MQDKVISFMNNYNMLRHADRIVVGVSGGADSVCLLLLLNGQREQKQLYLHVVHINHGIRGETALRDENFVREMCARLEVDFTCVKSDIPRIVAETGVSSEEAGRNVRYGAFLECCRANGCTKIAVAHNLDDNAETVMFNMLRGCGLHGICGIHPVRSISGEVEVIRPLLDVRKHGIIDFLREKKEDYCEDETNSEEEYSRNRLRNVVFPYICENINTASVEHLGALAQQACRINAYIEAQTDSAMAGIRRRDRLISDIETGTITLDIEELLACDSVIAGEIIRRLVGSLAGRLKDIDAVHISQCIELAGRQSGRSINLPYGLIVRRSYGQLIFEKGAKKQSFVKEVSISEEMLPCMVELDNRGTKLSLRIIDLEKSDIIPKKMCTKWFDYDKISNTILVRTRRQGDFLKIIKRRDSNEIVFGQKSLKSYFTDCKLEKEKRDTLPLLADGSHILWVVGMRSTDGLMVGESTVRVLEASLLIPEKDMTAVHGDTKENDERCF